MRLRRAGAQEVRVPGIRRGIQAAFERSGRALRGRDGSGEGQHGQTCLEYDKYGRKEFLSRRRYLGQLGRRRKTRQIFRPARRRAEVIAHLEQKAVVKERLRRPARAGESDRRRRTQELCRPRRAAQIFGLKSLVFCLKLF